MLVVKTSYRCSPTNGRAKAHASSKGNAKAIGVMWDHALSNAANHIRALELFCKQNGISGLKWEGGADNDGDYVWVAAASHTVTIG